MNYEDDELNTMLVLKYGPLAIHQEYIKSLPEPVCTKVSRAWPFITVKDVRAALLAYELGEEIPDGANKLNPLL